MLFFDIQQSHPSHVAEDVSFVFNPEVHNMRLRSHRCKHSHFNFKRLVLVFEQEDRMSTFASLFFKIASLADYRQAPMLIPKIEQT